MNNGSKALLAMVRKVEDILVGHGVTQSAVTYVSGTSFTDLRWNAKTHTVEYADGDSLLELLGSHLCPEVRDLPERLGNLVTHAIDRQKRHEAECEEAAREIAKYIANVGWYKPELVNPVEGVTPNGTY